ncbi:MAG TPA: phage terminase large subunit [Stellaceae bacterium]|nr:phage terminase large subunit [Stellaceae bacterium]
MILMPTRIEFDALTRISLALFVQRVFAELNSGESFLDNWHIHLIVQHLEDVRTGKILRLAINIPPRNLKSIIVSIAYVAWLLGHDPTTKIICASYNEDLALRLARMCLQVMQSKWYRILFPRTRLASDRPSAEFIQTTMGGHRMATSVGGTLGGFGAHYILLDDPTKPEEAASEARRQVANDWFSQGVPTRLDDKRCGRIVLVMQRLHEDDMTGHVLAQGGWIHLSLPAIAQADETHAIVTPFGLLHHWRREGEALHPEREPIEELTKLRVSMGSAFFSAQYLQSPTPPGGGLVKIDWFPRFKLEEPRRFDRIVQSWDTAVTAKELSSFSACTTWGIFDRKAYLIHVFRKRTEFPELRRAIISQARSFGASVVLIEDAASGASLLQDLRKDLSSVRGCKPAGDKIMRMNAQTAHIENGFVYLPKEAPWLPDLEHELMMFPKGRYDDQVDSISQALEFIFAQSDLDAQIEFCIRMMGIEAASDSPPRKVRAISTISNMNIELKTNSGRLVRPDANGIFWLTENEAQGIPFMPDMTILPD